MLISMNICNPFNSLHFTSRWGDYPEKTDVNYISKLIRDGGWFDDTKPFIKVEQSEMMTKNYAPKYLMDNPERFKYLLEKEEGNSIL